jgi:hypothetical protein
MANKSDDSSQATPSGLQPDLLHRPLYTPISALSFNSGNMRAPDNLFHPIAPTSAQFPRSDLFNGAVQGYNNPRDAQGLFDSIEEVYHRARGGVIGNP